MHRLIVVVATLPLAALLSGGACEAPPPPPNNNNNKNNNAPQTCTVGDADILKPDEAAVRPDGGAINLACVGNPEVLTASTEVRVQGCVDIFGLGGRAKRGITVGVYGEGQDPRSDEPEFGEVEIAVVEDAAGLDCTGVNANDAACIAAGCEKDGAYSIDGIPTHVPLTMKVSRAGDDTVIDTYTFGIVFDHGDQPAVDGVVTYAASLVYRSTYDSIPTLGGRFIDGQQTIGDGVGRGVIAGEIHDCDDKVVQGATVTTNHFDVSSKITYFNGNTENPTPNQSRLATNTDGLYVILNTTTDAGKDIHTVTAGIVDPACTGEDCQCVSMSSRTVRSYPDSVSIVTIRGDIPVLE